ncbi:MAG: ABC transporter permease [Armatimonadota bacterium]|nr:ABC transporter permease [Armatimonadota bacterium]MDR7452068.1 ABC transporter permease [Armatimonadota bacterium]MDR7466530.1 ABC transporter permease [Armatimonadota bacterium]MDR7493252.1 ABC transporter permease [Armatimonadota bacterium]MDR7499855.1 ABC transporter permease [Armatimonadota bacterium]
MNDTPILGRELLPGAARRETPVGQSYWQVAWRRFRKHRLAMVGGAIAAGLSAMALLAPWLAPYAFDQLSLGARWAPPGSGHWFGTDELGRDVLTRIMYAGRISLTVGYVVAVNVAVIGMVVGAVSGFYGGMVDAALMRLVDVLLSIPTLPLYLILAALIPGGGVSRIILIFTAFGWTGVARLVRGQVLSLRTLEFVQAAQAMGASEARVILRHLLPNALAPVIVAATLAVGGAILGESALSFLGLGIAPPTPSWGNMLQRAQEYIWNAPYLAVFPGLFIFVTVLSFNFLGDGLRDALDPRLRV